MARVKSGKARTGRNGGRKHAPPAAGELSQGPRPRTANELNDDERQALFFSHKREIAPLRARVEEANKLLKEAYALAKKSGFLKKEFELAFALATDAGEAKARADAERIMRLARWMGCTLGTQGELFGGDAAGKNRHREAGKRAALNDEPRRPPKELAQHEAQHWLGGHDEGRVLRNEALARNFKPLGEEAAQAVDSLAAH